MTVQRKTANGVRRMTYLDNGFWLISEASARRLCNLGPMDPDGRRVPLPRWGWERLIHFDGKDWWLSRTRTMGGVRWSIRER